MATSPMMDISPPCPWPGPSGPSAPHLGKLGGIALGHLKPIPGSGCSNRMWVPSKKIDGRFLMMWFLQVILGLILVLLTHVMSNKAKNPWVWWKRWKSGRKKKTISGGWTRWTWLNLHFHHFSVLLAYLDSKGKIYLEKKTYQILPAEHPH